MTSNKTKYFQWPDNKRLLFFLGRIYFTRNDGSQNTFVYQPTLEYIDRSESKKKIKALIMF